jgi:hypothetical protein
LTAATTAFASRRFRASGFSNATPVSWARPDRTGTTKQSAWEAHSRWIDQQASQRIVYGHQSMDSQQAAAARALAGNPDSQSPA